MYANTGYNSLWAYSNEDDSKVEYYNSPSLDSDGDSEQELRDIEELLYSHVHYEPNHLCTTVTPDDLSSTDVLVTTQLSDGALDGFEVSRSESGQEICVTSSDADNSWVVIDEALPQDAVACNTTAADNLSAVKLKRKTSSCKTAKSASEIRTKSKKTDANGSQSSIAVGTSAVENTCSLNLLDGSKVGGAGVSNGSKRETGQPTGQKLVKKQLKAKCKKKTSSHAAADNPVKPIVVDLASESSSDVFCCDLSSDLSSDDEEDDIKLSNINVDLSRASDNIALTDVLNSLSDCSWDVNAQDRAANTPNIARYYTPTTNRARCVNCNERGHFARDCTQPRKLLACILCGVRGHLSRSCPDSLCFNCRRPGHAVRECNRRRMWNVICQRCEMRGHIQQDCPDLWRQYHLTTSPGHTVTSKPAEVERKFCYNCGASGHFGHECDEDRMDSFSLPTLPYIARYDRHSPTRSQSGSRNKEWQHSKTDTTDHKRDISSSRHQQHARDEKRCDRNLQSLVEKAHTSDSSSRHNFSHMKGKSDLFASRSHSVSDFDKNNRKDSSSRVVTDHGNHQANSYVSKQRHRLSTAVTFDRFRGTINVREHASQSHIRKSAPRRSHSADSTNELFGSNSNDIDSPVHRENLSYSDLKQGMKKKSQYQQRIRGKSRGLVKTPVHREPVISGDTRYKKKTPPTMKHNAFRNKVLLCEDSTLGKDRKVIQTARGFLMTVDYH